MTAFLVVMVCVLSLFLAGTWVVLYQVVKQQGRLLLRLDALQEGKRTCGDNEIVLHGQRNEEKTAAGLAVGTAIPSFQLPDLAGQQVAIEQFRGKRLLLVHWSPSCGFCTRIAPDLAKLQPEFSKHNVQLLLLAQGTAAANRALAEKYDLACPILSLEGTETPDLFGQMGTPVAYLIDEEGKVAQPLAIGANAVPLLAQEAVAGKPLRKRLPNEKPLSQSRIERDGLKAGTPAPSFELPDIHGQTVKLDEYRGRKVLLVFSDPHCGPCNELAPHLVRLHHEHRNNGLSVVMVGRGEPEENRQKAEEHGFEFPMVLQRKWELSKEYGIFATPVAFLIDESGNIARDVAKGGDAILQLAQEDIVHDMEGIR